jgi:branched-chain amino acid transport system substrate-binding protein
MRQATNLHNLDLPTRLPGIRLNTGPTNYRPMRALQLMRWDGKTWVRFGDVIEGVQT